MLLLLLGKKSGEIESVLNIKSENPVRWKSFWR